MAMIAHPHIRLDPEDIAWIDGATVKVIEVTLDASACFLSAE
jgi:hypothetical protein